MVLVTVPLLILDGGRAIPHGCGERRCELRLDCRLADGWLVVVALAAPLSSCPRSSRYDSRSSCETRARRAKRWRCCGGGPIV